MSKLAKDESREEYDEIWEFVEQKLNVDVPIYFKNILKVCGFNNGITIASIVEEDIVYFEDEVQNGNVAKSFKDSVNTLEGSMRSQGDFQFTRGHKKFLLAIAATLKEHIRENGQDSCIVKVASKKNTKGTGKATKNKPVKRLCLPSKKKNISNVNSFVESAIAIQELSEGVATDQDMKEHKRIILNKIVNSLIKHTEDMFNENIDYIKKQMSSNRATNLLQIEEKQSANDNGKDFAADSEEENEKETGGKCVETANETDTASKYTALVRCPFGCIKPTTLFHIPTILNFFLWNTSNFDRHLKLKHKSDSISRKDSIIDATITKAESDSKAIVNTDNLSIISDPCTSEIAEKVKPRIQQSLLSESVINDVQEETLEKVEKIQPSLLSESGKQGNVEKKVKKRKKNRQSSLDDNGKQDFEKKTLEKVENVKPSVKPQIQQSMLSESVIHDVNEKTIEKVKENQSSLWGESVTQEEETLQKADKIQPSLLSESRKQCNVLGNAEKKIKKRKKNRQSLFDNNVDEDLQEQRSEKPLEKPSEKRQKIQRSLMSDGVKDEVKEWAKKKKLERRKKNQLTLLSLSVEPGVNKKKLEEGWRKYV